MVHYTKLTVKQLKSLKVGLMNSEELVTIVLLCVLDSIKLKVFNALTENFMF